MKDDSVAAIIQELGDRLKRARLNRNMTQLEIANLTGVSRKAVLNAEKGNAHLEVFVNIMVALDVAGQLDSFLPKQIISPLQLSKMQGKIRKRASRSSIAVAKK
ncbi:helix-turn-helix domain-containing protein [Aeromonas veronii]|uniref:helix-turn-helix transcriptional regulator n=1 Tax=Aeromonas veronii TaxID=654 RepID=UPI0013026169|nr:helix-turn-helix transcriptional regulator [Aeromonas veronii]KAE9625337.1 helix-turn-helix domain-containing protein [Aeromonas veronii]MBW3777294.1 helix-turn-helix domain-containing protein [Aeromonas veronii]